MRTFHIGGTASGIAEQSSFVAKHDGIVQLRGIRTVKNREGQTYCDEPKGTISYCFSRWP